MLDIESMRSFLTLGVWKLQFDSYSLRNVTMVHLSHKVSLNVVFKRSFLIYRVRS